MPKLVFDRGFCNKRILRYLKRSKVTFYIRACAWIRVTAEDGSKKRVSEFTVGSHSVSFGCKLRLIVGQKTNEHNEPWYILTTDLKSSPAAIVTTYYYRFEIEELFRDIKSLLHTKNSKLKKPVNLATLLWYVCLGIVLLIKCKATQNERHTPSHVHSKKKLSSIRQLFERLENELRIQMDSNCVRAG